MDPSMLGNFTCTLSPHIMKKPGKRHREREK
jgi:hypothetical protein